MSGIMAIVLAAGESTRMGSPKMLLPFRGTTVIEQVLQHVLPSGIDRTFVIVGAESGKISSLIKKYPVTIINNTNFRDGMLSSVISGVRSLPPETAAFLVLPGDQPLIRPGTVSLLIDEYMAGGKGIIVPVYNGKRGHPALIDSKYRTEIETLAAAEGLRGLMSKFPADVQEVTTDDPGVLKDLDTYDEYLQELTQTT